MLNRRGKQHEDRVHEQRGQDEQPADDGLPADPFIEGGPPGDCGEPQGDCLTVIDVTVDLAGAGIVLRPSPLLLSEFPLVFCLNGFEQTGSVLLPPTIFWSSGVQPWAKIELVALAMKSIEVPACAHHWSGSERLVRDRACSDGRHRGIRRPARVGAADGHIDLRGPVSFVATQLRKNAAQSAFLALAAMP